jgi:CheY-like chemotaxis protein/HPt (histidine-containing phosphotransfer) domain-containing protein
MPPGEVSLLVPALPSQLRQAIGADPGAGRRAARRSDGPDASRPDALAGASVPGAFKGIDVLLVEDNDLNRALVLAILSDSGASVRIAENGIQAVEAVREKLPDVVLMDVHMPLMDGYQATAAIRALGPIGPRSADPCDDRRRAGGRSRPDAACRHERSSDQARRAGPSDGGAVPLDHRAAGQRSPLRGRPRAGLTDRTLADEDEPAAAARRRGRHGRASGGQWRRLWRCSMSMKAFAAALAVPALFAQGLKIFLDVYSPVVGQLAQMHLDQPKAGDPDIKRLAHTLKGSVRSLGMFALAELAARIDAELRAGGAPDARQQANCWPACRSPWRVPRSVSIR